MRWYGPIALAIMASAASPAGAQENGSHPDLTARAANFAEGRMVGYLQEARQREACAKVGCLFIVNRSSDQDIVELRFDTIVPGAPHEPVWSNNALRRPIRPKQTAGLMKFGDRTLCALPARLLLIDRRDRSSQAIEGVMNLCTAPGAEVFGVGPPPVPNPRPTEP